MLKLLAIASAATLLGTSAFAATVTPVLSGKYVYSSEQVCTSTQSSISFDSGTIDINAPLGKFTITFSHTGGSYPGSTGNQSFSLSQNLGKGTYSNTATTLTIKPQGSPSQVYQASYGGVKSTGIASYAVLVSISDGGQCENRGWLMLQ